MSTRIGAGIVIKVMPGDTISISSQAWYTGSTQAPPTGLPAIADQLLTLISNGIVANGGTRRKHSREMQITGVSIMMDHVSTPFVRQSVLEEAKPTDLPDYTTFLPAGYKYGDTYDRTNAIQKNNPLFYNFPLPVPGKTPLFGIQAVAKSDFRLQAGSPAIGKGYASFLPLATVPMDLVYGITAITLPGADIGAFQTNGKGNQHY